MPPRQLAPLVPQYPLVANFAAALRACLLCRLPLIIRGYCGYPGWAGDSGFIWNSDTFGCEFAQPIAGERIEVLTSSDPFGRIATVLNEERTAVLVEFQKHPLPEAVTDRCAIALQLPMLRADVFANLAAAVSSIDLTAKQLYEGRMIALSHCLTSGRFRGLSMELLRIVRSTRPDTSEFCQAHGAERKALRQAVLGGASPRASRHIFLLLGVWAFLRGRQEICLDDLHEIVPLALPHRLSLHRHAPEGTTRTVINNICAAIPKYLL